MPLKFEYIFNNILITEKAMTRRKSSNVAAVQRKTMNRQRPRAMGNFSL